MITALGLGILAQEVAIVASGTLAHQANVVHGPNNEGRSAGMAGIALPVVRNMGCTLAHRIRSIVAS